jgi:hypothetical protein
MEIPVQTLVYELAHLWTLEESLDHGPASLRDVPRRLPTKSLSSSGLDFRIGGGSHEVG